MQIRQDSKYAVMTAFFLNVPFTLSSNKIKFNVGRK